MSSDYHVPIMAQEVLALLEPERGGVYVDGTLGGGGHAEAILSVLPKGGRLIGIDRDGDAIQTACKRLQRFGNAFLALRGNFFHMRALLEAQGIKTVHGILLDLGVSSHQLDTPERGFSYHNEAALDMRMDSSAPLTAYDVVNGYSFEELARILREYGEERYAGRIAAAIVREREKSPINSTTRLAELVRAATPAAKRWEGQHPARRAFQAIRIEVNDELGGLKKALCDAQELLCAGGRMAVITFHSLEDRIVKQLYHEWEHPCTCPPKAPACICGKQPTARILNKKPMVAGKEEEEENPRARSAKLRGMMRL